MHGRLALSSYKQSQRNRGLRKSTLKLVETDIHIMYNRYWAEGEKCGKVAYPLKDNIRLTNTCALAIREFPDSLEIIGE